MNTTTRTAGRITRMFLATALSWGLLATGHARAEAPDLMISDLQLVTSKRINRTVYEYTYRAVAQNRGGAAEAVKATLNSWPSQVSVLDGEASFGALSSGQSLASADTVTLRHDRSKGAFTAQNLIWAISVTEPGGGLVGDPGSPAIMAVGNYVSNTPYQPAEISTDPDLGQILRTGVVIYFKQDATVEQVNNAIQAVNGRISASVAGVASVALSIPDPGSVANLNAAIQGLLSKPGIWYAAPEVFPGSMVLPPNPSFQVDPPTRIDGISHQLAIRSHAAWNAIELFRKTQLDGKAPTIALIDYFGDGPPEAALGFDLDFDASDYATGRGTNGSASNHFHGYNVLSVLASSFGGDDTKNDIATGVVPLQLRVKAFDLQMQTPSLSNATFFNFLDDEKAAGRNVILNTSVGWDYSSCVLLQGTTNFYCPPHTPTLPQQQVAYASGLNWVWALRGADPRLLPGLGGSREFQFLHLTAAGNNGLWPAYDTSAYGLNSVPAPGTGYTGVPIYSNGWNLVSDPATNAVLTYPWLQNTLVVEGRNGMDGVDTASEPVKPVSNCMDHSILQVFSFGGHLSAIGDMFERKPSGAVAPRGLYLPFEPPTYYGRGSSFASPQAAGVAALVWSARPDLTMQQVRQILLKTAGGVNTPGVCPNTDTDFYHQPVDAYAAVLAADCPTFLCNLGSTATATNSPVRLAILDVASGDLAGNFVDSPGGGFTQADIYKYLNEFQTRRGASLDYSRYDLNGDGRTGEPWVVRQGQARISRDTALGSQRFDLNGDGQFTTATQVVEGVTMTFEENNLTDIAILVYYSYSPLYEGSSYERTMLLLQYLEWANAGDQIKPFMRTLKFQLTGLTGIAGDTTLGWIYYQASQADPANADFYGNRFISGCGQEQGTPLFSQEVLAAKAAASVLDADDVLSSTWWWATSTANTPPAGSVTKRCSDFIAAVPSTGKMWVNITKFVAATPKREYQLRLYLGEPDFSPASDSSVGFNPTGLRLATQQGNFGYVDTDAGGFFQSGLPSSNFKLLNVGFVGEVNYSYQVRD